MSVKLHPSTCDRVKQFPSTAMVYHEVMTNWVNTMHFISGSNRAMEKLNIFGGAAKESSEARLVAEIEALERQVGGTDRTKKNVEANHGTKKSTLKLIMEQRAFLKLIKEQKVF